MKSTMLTLILFLASTTFADQTVQPSNCLNQDEVLQIAKKNWYCLSDDQIKIILATEMAAKGSTLSFRKEFAEMLDNMNTLCKQASESKNSNN